MVEKALSQQKEASIFTIADFRRALYVRFNQPTMFWALMAMILSYFYNLSVFNYSLLGTNELRLYDFAGLILFYYYFNNFKYTQHFIHTQPFFRSLYQFLMYCLITLVFTMFFSILSQKFLYFFSGILYLYHFYTFFLTAVYMSILMRNAKNLKTFVTTSLVISSIAFSIVLLQNMGILPFLWNDLYRDTYDAFLSGTFGPNKIVLGMSALMMSILSIALINTRSVTINKVYIYINLGLALLTLALSGSRTAYVGLGVFVFYFAVRRPTSLIYSAAGMAAFLLFVLIVQPQIIQKTIEVYEKRVEKKISSEEDLRDANVTRLYEDMGAGRNILLVRYLDLLADEYYFIPLGRGFNNRIDTSSSAHNMYLSLIYEVGLVGMVLYFRWLVLYLFVRMRRLKVMETALHGLILSMIITLFFGEHLYVYRALFGLVGLFLFVVTVLTSPLFLVEETSKENVSTEEEPR